MIDFMDMEYIYEKIRENMMEIGFKENYMAKALFGDLIRENISANFLWT